MKIEEILQKGQNSNENFGAYIPLQYLLRDIIFGISVFLLALCTCSLSIYVEIQPKAGNSWDIDGIYFLESHIKQFIDENWGDCPHMSNENNSKINEISKDLIGRIMKKI